MIRELLICIESVIKFNLNTELVKLHSYKATNSSRVKGMQKKK